MGERHEYATAHGGAGPPALSALNKAGLILAILLGLAELPAPFRLGGNYKPGTDGPPVPVAIGGAGLGLVTVIAAIYVWVSRNRVGGRIVAGTLILSTIPSLGALFVPSVPAMGRAALAALVVVAIVTVMLVLARPKPAA
jgi:hypothetical protein